MNCLDFRQLLDDQLDGALDAEAEAAVLAHVHACVRCARLRADAIEVQRALRELPAAQPEAGFAERMLAGVRAAQPATTEPTLLRRWGGIGAMAASVAAAVALGTWIPDDAEPESVAGGAEPVRLVFRSESPVRGVTFELELPDGVELSGYPGQRRLVWQSDLRTGENLLELPVQPGGKGGVVTATLNLGSERRQFSVRIVPTKVAAAPVSAMRESMDDAVLATGATSWEVRRHA